MSRMYSSYISFNTPNLLKQVTMVFSSGIRGLLNVIVSLGQLLVEVKLIIHRQLGVGISTRRKELGNPGDKYICTSLKCVAGDGIQKELPSVVIQASSGIARGNGKMNRIPTWEKHDFPHHLSTQNRTRTLLTAGNLFHTTKKREG